MVLKNQYDELSFCIVAIFFLEEIEIYENTLSLCINYTSYAYM